MFCYICIRHQEYWNWSWDELTAYDLPATFEYVYNQTGQQQLHYVGHSLVTTAIYICIYMNMHVCSYKTSTIYNECRCREP